MERNYNKELSDAIKSHLEYQNISSYDFAIKLCAHTELVKKMLSGDYIFTLEKIVRIEIVLGIKLISFELNESVIA